jgi:hypothetical protein
MIRKIEQVVYQAKRLQQQAAQVKNNVVKYREHLDANTICFINIVNIGDVFYK